MKFDPSPLTSRAGGRAGGITAIAATALAPPLKREMRKLDEPSNEGSKIDPSPPTI
jgi:hypothetical protein